MRKLIIATGADTETLKTVKQIGWDGVFVGWGKDFDANGVISRIREQGLMLQSVHAPFTGTWKMWEGTDSEAQEEIDAQINCLRDTARMDCDLVVMHAIIGMDRNTPTEQGVERYAKLVDEARKLGVRIALENTEGEIYLKTLLDAFDNEQHVGFCVDTGHEQCYNHGTDTIGKYGKRLFGTHLNDNFGMTGEKLTWLDDAHVLPFDGIADWAGIAARLIKAGFTGPLTFELNQKGRPDRHANDRYQTMTYAEYLAVAYEHARCVASLVEHAEVRA